MAVALAPYKVLTAVHKHYTVEEWIAFDKTANDEVMAHVRSRGMVLFLLCASVRGR